MLQNLTPTQKDLALDLINACRYVTPAFDQQEAFELELQAVAETDECKKMASDASKEVPCYKNALSVFIDAYSQCEEHGIPVEVLDDLTSHYLPHGLCMRLYAGNPP